MRRSALLLVSFVTACGPSQPGDTARAADTGTDQIPTMGDDDDDVPMPTVTTNPQEPGLWGKLIDADGQPLGGYDVLACSTAACLNGVTAEDGSFVFQSDPGTSIVVKTHEIISGDTPRAVGVEPCVVVDGPAVPLGTVYVPDLPEGASLGSEDQDPQELAVGDGLELTLNVADLKAPFGVFLDAIGAVRIPAEHVPTYQELEGEEVIAVFAMYPFSTTSETPISLAMPTALEAGTQVNVRTIDYLDGHMSDAATATSDGTMLETDPGQGIHDLTYVVISRP